MTRQPNFIYIGTSKAGSTWLFDVLSRHPEVFMTPVKGTYFFDHHFENGWPWYLQNFSGATTEPIVGEISHSYLYSELACERIAEMDPNIKLMLCLREPIDRAMSMYLDGIRNRKWTGSFEQCCADTREIVEEGCYAKYLEPFLQCFSREQIHVALFDELQADPQSYARGIFDALGIAHRPLDQRLTTKVMPACLPRHKRLVQVSKSMSETCRKLGLKKLRGRVKRSRMIRNLLYRNVPASERADMPDDLRKSLKQRFLPEVQRLDEMLGTQLAQRWFYPGNAQTPEPHEESLANS